MTAGSSFFLLNAQPPASIHCVSYCLGCVHAQGEQDAEVLSKVGSGTTEAPPCPTHLVSDDSSIAHLIVPVLLNLHVPANEQCADLCSLPCLAC